MTKINFQDFYITDEEKEARIKENPNIAKGAIAMESYFRYQAQEKLADFLKDTIRKYGKSGKLSVTITYKDGEKNGYKQEKTRLAIATNGDIITTFKNSRSRGAYFFNGNKIDEIESVEFGKVSKVSDADKWRKSWQKVSNKLAESGLWSDYKNQVDTALAVGYDKIQEARKAMNSKTDGLSYYDNESENAKQVEKIDNRLVKNGENGVYVDTNIMWYMTYPAKVKKMYFGKYDTKQKLELIKSILESGKDGSVNGYSNYDVSFSYKAEAKKAWYSEEYRGCGNGHYYLALDATHALFYEDD